MSDLNRTLPGSCYDQSYDDEFRWLSYWQQISNVLRLERNKVLEVGIGNATVRDYLRKAGLDICSCDINRALAPECVADVVNLPYKEECFDIILCCEVLEHIPFPNCLQALEEIYRVTSEYAIISLPFSGRFFSLGFNFSRTSRREKVFRFPLCSEHRFDGYHYWEIGKRGYPLAKVNKVIGEAGFHIVDTAKIYFNPRQMIYYYVLKKR